MIWYLGLNECDSAYRFLYTPVHYSNSSLKIFYFRDIEILTLKRLILESRISIHMHSNLTFWTISTEYLHKNAATQLKVRVSGFYSTHTELKWPLLFPATIFIYCTSYNIMYSVGSCCSRCCCLFLLLSFSGSFAFAILRVTLHLYNRKFRQQFTGAL